MLETNLDLYLLASFSFAVILSLITAKVTATLVQQRSEMTYVEFDISPRDLRDSAAQAVRDDCHTLVLPQVYADNNKRKLVQVCFTDQRLRLDHNYEYLSVDDVIDDDDDGDYITAR